MEPDFGETRMGMSAAGNTDPLRAGRQRISHEEDEGMFGKMLREMTALNDIRGYERFKTLFRQFIDLCKSSFGADNGYAVENVTATSARFILFDRIAVTVFFSMTVDEARTKRTGRLIFSRQDGEEARIPWVVYFDENGNMNEKPYRTSEWLNMLKQEDLGRILVHIVDLCEPCFEVAE